MEAQMLGLLIGGIFGAGLVLAGLADPDKIVGTLRLKDFHAMRTIAVFVLVGMAGTWFLDKAGMANFSIKPASIVAVLIGGGLLGIGFGLTGYCPGTGLACAASGRFDALVTVIGMLLGALVFILIYPGVVVPIDKLYAYGKKTIPEITNITSTVWVWSLVGVGTAVLYLTRPREKKTAN